MIPDQLLEAYNSYTDKHLFNLIAENNEPAFEAFFYRYLPKLQPVILKMVKEESVVNDIIQEMFLNLWIDRHRLPEIESPANWIFRLMYNRSLNWIKQQATRNKLLQSHIESQSKPEINHTELVVSFAETSRLVKEAILQLPPQAKKIYLLSREQGMKILEVAEELGLSPQTVKNSLGRSANSIREYLAKHDIPAPLVIFIFTFL